MKHTEESKYEKIGRTVFSISYFFYALKFILISSAVWLVILYFFHKPLWLAPLGAIAVFLLYRAVYRLLFVLLMKWSKQ